ncbi:CsiV family protein [Thalassomonas sp. M1454]|uniref:CsiV family protein n=1 Tax=Thalassomonas sp. M1454 TaxID=2594477 RepID=UPI00117C4110|nr:CsiV family protein [Thalassomonas sp. M1454]TRX57113.1 hypothetical protein FNN08_06335 [Thalassomonas sp. M1454]
MVQQLYKNKMAKRNKQRKNHLALISLALSSTLSFSAFSFEQEQEQQETKPAERWFEIEVILIEQLMNKDRYNEDFSVETGVKTNRNAIDLINRELKNIVTYKQQLKSCDSSALDNVSEAEQGAEISSEDLQQQVANIEQNITCTPYQQSDFIDPVSEQVNAIPRTLSGNEDLYSNSPYLIAEEHLQLSHIVKSLKRSKQFRPLLHLAWRQAVVARPQAVPVKLIAGENLALAQNKMLKTEQIVTELVPEQDSDTSLIVDESGNIELTQAQQEDILIKQHLDSIIATVQQAEQESTDIATSEITTAIGGSSNIDSATIDTSSIIAEIKRGDNQPIIAQVESAEIVDEETITPGWFIDGLFKVHLDHYLYINSEFNVHSQISGDSANQQKSVLIPFKQNRRVISGEVHYFDHPYMGMIVQIRRHERPEPEVEAETELEDNVLEEVTATENTTF